MLPNKCHNRYKKDYNGERFKSTFFALVAERGINSLVAMIGIALLGGSGHKLPHLDIFNSGMSQMFAMAASNEALRYVSYPTQVLGKSCKMIPVMVGGLVLGGRKFSVSQYIQVLVITAGVVVFNFGAPSKKGKGNDSTYGLTLILVSLVMDAVTGGLQDRVKAATTAINPGVEKAKPTMHESMFYTNAAGTLVAIVLAAATGQLAEGYDFCTRNPEVSKAIVMYSLASAVGQNFVYFTITQFDALLLTTVTTTRKIFSTVYSVIRNPDNTLNAVQWTGCGMVFAILGLEVVEKYFKAQSAKRLAPAGDKKA